MIEAHHHPVPVRGAAVAALAEVRAVVADLAAAAGVRDPNDFAHRFQIVMAGSITAALHGDVNAAKHGRSLAGLLFAQEISAK